MQHYSYLRIAPFTALLDSTRGEPDHQGGPDFPKWDLETHSRHCRYGDKPMDVNPAQARFEPRILRGNFAWLGPASHHFGHQISDFSMRILETKNSGFDGTYVFGGKPTLDETFAAVPRFLDEIVTYFGLPRDRVRIITKDSLLQNVLIAPQAETAFGPPPSDDYLDALEENFEERRWITRRKITDSRIVYISRSGLNRGVFAGEKAIENFMSAIGARIVIPERMPIEELLEIYTRAEFIVGSEGSAFHMLQLLGKQLQNVVVIRRRNDSHLFGEPFLRARCKSLTYVDAVEGGISGLATRRYRETGLIVLSFERLRDGLRAALPIDVLSLSEAEFRSDMAASLNNWFYTWWLRRQASEKGLDVLRDEVETFGLALTPAQTILARTKTPHPPSRSELLAVFSAGSSPADGRGRLRIAAELVAQGDTSKAAVLNNALEAGSDYSAEELGELAQMFWKQKMPALAKRAIDLAVAASPNVFWMWLHKAHVERSLGDLPSAKSAAERAVKIDPGRADALFLLAIIALETGDRAEALESIESAIARNPEPKYLQWREANKLTSAKADLPA